MPHILVRRVIVAALAVTLHAAGLAAQTTAIVDIQALAPRDYRAQAFVLAAPQTITIDAVGGEPRLDRRDRNRFSENWRGNEDDRDVWPAAAWILDARTREVVWDLRTANSGRDRSGIRRFNGTVRLPAGTYIAHYASFVATSVTTFGDNSFASFVRGLAGQRGRVKYSGPYVDDNSYREFQIVVRGDGRRATESEAANAGRAFTETAVVTIRPDSGSSSQRRGFELTREADVEVIAIGEMARDDGNYDYAWIQDVESRRRVWTMNYRRTDDAGGAHKNRLARETVHLPAGRYVAYYVTDDSHDPAEWNSMPPLDPETYGLTVRIADASTRSAVRPFEWEPVPAGQTIISMVGIGDNESRSEGFTLTRPMEVRIYAIGEGSNPEGDMDDYAWIVDASTRRRVWTMDYDRTEHAGGAEKNRLFDGTVRLDAGSYLVYYTSDGSHSAREFNSAAPAEARYWGVTVFPASGRLDRGAVAPYERPGRTASIAELTRMRDDVRARRSFTIDSDQTVRVYAIGEGIDGEMYDWGWIENAETGRTVWEMTYRTTERAGGAAKNRVFDGTIRLPAGRYILRWESDGSHAFGDWNDSAPDDPEMWGITVMRMGR